MVAVMHLELEGFAFSQLDFRVDLDQLNDWQKQVTVL